MGRGSDRAHAPGRFRHRELGHLRRRVERFLSPAALAALGITLGAATLCGQGATDIPITIDLAAARLRYADSVNATALSISPGLRFRAPHSSMDGYGTLSQLQGAFTVSGLVDGSVFPIERAHRAMEIELVAGGSRHHDGSRTGQFLASGRAHFMGFARGASVGVGAGRTWDGSWSSIVQGDAGGWISRGRHLWSLQLTPTSVDDSIRYMDAAAAWRLADPRGTLVITAGARAGSALPPLQSSDRVWGGVTATWSVAQGVALVASGGSYPVDFTQGFPGGRYLSIGMRIGSRRALRLSTPAIPVASPTSAIAQFTVKLVSGDSIELGVQAPAARRVELSGDFTAWAATPLQRGERGWWRIVLPIGPGTHQVNVRVDRGLWLVPPGLTPLRDEFGVETGLLVVQR